MLTFAEIVLYHQIVFWLLGMAILMFGSAIAIRILANDRVLDIFALFAVAVGIAMLSMAISTVALDTIEYTTITPCNMAPVEKVGMYIADYDGRTYQVSPLISLKLHINQTSDIVVSHEWQAWWVPPAIVNVTGSVCSPSLLCK